MDFFERQDNARRKSGLLLLLFVIAIVLVIAAVNFVIYLTFKYSNPYQFSVEQWWLGKPMLITSIVTFAVIAGGSLYQYIRMGDGGESVARMAGATKVDYESKDSNILTYINIVEEMSIASGMPVPAIYVMEKEDSINAFVAGYSSQDVVVVATRGALDNLSREQLQGVIGHEFSHILNSDTLINLRLMALLSGILFIGEIGQFLMRSSSSRHRRRYSSRSSKQDGSQFLLGIALFVIGYIGVFMGRIIKSAVARQREFLADASSVQFTRNPEGIAGALFAIEQHSHSSYLDHTMQAENINHMCFGESVKIGISSLLASHPPIKDRIDAIGTTLYPRLRSSYRKEKAQSPNKASSAPTSTAQMTGFAGATEPTTVAPTPTGATNTKTLSAIEPHNLVNEVGTVTPENVDYAQSVLQSIPTEIYSLAHSVTGSAAIITAMMLIENTRHDTLEAEASKAENWLQNSDISLQGVTSLDLSHTCTLINTLDRRAKMPLLELCANRLREIGYENGRAFLKGVSEVAKSDGKISLFEFFSLSFLDYHLATKIKKPKIVVHTLKDAKAEISIILSLIYKAGKNTSESDKALAESVLERLCGKESKLFEDKLTIKKLNQAFLKIRGLSPLLKKSLLEAAIDLIMSDNQVTIEEYEILRALSSCLDCPMPALDQ